MRFVGELRFLPILLLQAVWRLTLDVCAAACSALAALGPQLEALAGPLATALHAAGSRDASHSPLVALVLNARRLYGSSCELATSIRLTRGQPQQLGCGMRLLTKAGLAGITPLIPRETAAGARDLVGQLLRAFEHAAADLGKHVLKAVPAEEAVALLTYLNLLISRGELP